MTMGKSKNKEEEKQAKRSLNYEINMARIPKINWPKQLPFLANVSDDEIQNMQKKKLQYVAGTSSCRKAQEPMKYKTSVPLTESGSIKKVIPLQDTLPAEVMEGLQEKLEKGTIEDALFFDIMDSIFNKRYQNIMYILKKPEKK